MTAAFANNKGIQGGGERIRLNGTPSPIYIDTIEPPRISPRENERASHQKPNMVLTAPNFVYQENLVQVPSPTIKIKKNNITPSCANTCPCT